MFFDSHAHLTGDPLFATFKEILDRSRTAQVKGILNICTDPLSLERALLINEEGFFVAGATTPQDAAAEGEGAFACFERAAKDKKLHAIGETGLDYFEEEGTWSVQRHFLEKYMALAEETKLPLIFHCRGAFDDLYEVTKGYKGKAIMHCFTGSMQEAERALERGWMISFSGILTFKKSVALREVARTVPRENLFIETDAPYLAPQSRRGKVNEPAFVVETCEVLGALQGISLEEMAKVTYDNVIRILNIQ
jgi:TatD DNase family protein